MKARNVWRAPERVMGGEKGKIEGGLEVIDIHQSPLIEHATETRSPSFLSYCAKRIVLRTLNLRVASGHMSLRVDIKSKHDRGRPHGAARTQT